MRKKIRLNEWYATAISGNGILSSLLYVSSIAIIYAGIYAPLILVVVALLLYFYRAVYVEVVEALPINGGAYNCLLNSTSKSIAAVGGVITILSYTATAVLSANVAVRYLHTMLPVPISVTTMGLLLFFAIVVLFGIRDSAKVACGIFIFHLFVLGLFLFLGMWSLIADHSYLLENLHFTHAFITGGGLLKALFLGFSVSLLGAAGFESAANFIEEQQKGIFRHVLRNLLIGVAVFNPLVVLIILHALPIHSAAAAQDFLLAAVAKVIGGTFFEHLVVIDAFLVLAGAVLAAYIGVMGLVYRMATDACLPEFLTYQNRFRTYPLIIGAFLLLCLAIFAMTQGNLLSLAGMYTLAFLGVMGLFAFGNLILRETRSDLKRTYHAPLLFVLLAVCSTIIGIIGNIVVQPNTLVYFAVYFIPAMLFVLAFVYQDYNMKILLRLTRHIPFLHTYLEKQFADMTEGTLVAFVHHIGNLHRILTYIDRNELGWNIILVHCNNDGSSEYSKSYHEIKESLPILQKAGMQPYFTIKLLYKRDPFSPRVVQEVARELHVRKNRILIGSIHESHEFDYAELGGVRIIF